MKRILVGLDRCPQRCAVLPGVGRHVKGEGPTEYVRKLLDSAQDLINVDLVLMDREFDSQHLLEEVVNRGLDYVVPKRKQTSEKAKSKQMERFSIDSLIKKRRVAPGIERVARNEPDLRAKAQLGRRVGGGARTVRRVHDVAVATDHGAR